MERELGVSLRDVEAAEAETVRKLAADRGVGARCGNGLFSTYKSPKFYLSFTILVSLILVKYPDRIGPVNTVPWYLRYGTSTEVYSTTQYPSDPPRPPGPGPSPARARIRFAAVRRDLAQRPASCASGACGG